MWMSLLCRLQVAINRKFWQILTFGGLQYRPPFTDEGQVRCARADRRSTLSRQISSECVYCVSFRWSKTTLLGKFVVLGAPVPIPLHRWGPNLVCYCRPTVHVYVPKFVSIGLFWRPLAAKNPNFCRFWTSAFSDVDSWQQSEKVQHGCATTNIPLSNDIKIFSEIQCLHREIGRTNSDIQL